MSLYETISVINSCVVKVWSYPTLMIKLYMQVKISSSNIKCICSFLYFKFDEIDVFKKDLVLKVFEYFGVENHCRGNFCQHTLFCINIGTVNVIIHLVASKVMRTL